MITSFISKSSTHSNYLFLTSTERVSSHFRITAIVITMLQKREPKIQIIFINGSKKYAEITIEREDVILPNSYKVNLLRFAANIHCRI